MVLSQVDSEGQSSYPTSCQLVDTTLLNHNLSLFLFFNVCRCFACKHACAPYECPQCPPKSGEVTGFSGTGVIASLLHSVPAALHGFSISSTLGSPWQLRPSSQLHTGTDWLYHTMSALSSSPWPLKSCIFYAFKPSTMWIMLLSTSSAVSWRCSLPLLEHSSIRIYVLTRGNTFLLSHWSLELHFRGVDLSDNHSCFFCPSPISTHRFLSKMPHGMTPLIKSLIFSKTPWTGSQ